LAETRRKSFKDSFIAPEKSFKTFVPNCVVWANREFLLGTRSIWVTLKEEGKMKELVLYIAKALVDNPDKVEVTEISGEKATVLELRVAESDRGKVIGKEGRIIKSIRTIVNSASAKMDKRATVEIIE
jgi:uncharacterized protein